jgi:hypothetical protein
VGFITVLCIGNYFRAKRAQERQRQRRMAKLQAAGGGANRPGSINGGSSPRSAFDSSMVSSNDGGSLPGAGGYEAPIISGVRA